MPKPRPDLAARMDLELAEPPPVDARPESADATAAGRKGRGGTYVAPSRQNMKRIQGYFSPRVKRQLRLLAAQEDKTEEQLVGEALNLLFKTHSLPAIAFEGKDGGFCPNPPT
jgi:hypothetical protein